MHISQILLWILYSPLLCQTCFPRLNEGKCPRHDHGIYLTDIVQFYVERFSSLKAILFYDDITRTDFSMIFNSRGFSDDCVFKTTFYEGGFSQFLCLITFPHVTIQVKRGRPFFRTYTILDTMGHELNNMSARAEVNVFNSQKATFVHIAKLTFTNLYEKFVKKAVEQNETSDWHKAVMSKIQSLSEWADLQGNALTGGENHLGRAVMATEAALAFRQKSLFQGAIWTVEKDASEDLSGGVDGGTASEAVAELSVPSPLVELDDWDVLKVQRKLSLAIGRNLSGGL
ncbi:hypothetical protein SprV_0702385200 [Sparganum proliferum]